MQLTTTSLLPMILRTVLGQELKFCSRNKSTNPNLIKMIICVVSASDLWPEDVSGDDYGITLFFEGPQ